MANVISLDEYRDRRKGPLAQAIERLDRAVGRLDPLVHDRTGRLGAASTLSPQAIARASTHHDITGAGLPDPRGGSNATSF